MRHSGEYTRAAQLLAEEARAVRAQWGQEFDLLLTPTMACLPPPVDALLKEANEDPGGPRTTETQMISFTSICNITGQPAVSLPTFTSAGGLPMRQSADCRAVGRGRPHPGLRRTGGTGRMAAPSPRALRRLSRQLCAE